VLFDLSGKRKNVVRVVYGFLALLFAGGFLLFGIGSESGIGGIGDLFGFGTSNTGNDNPAFEDRINEAEEKLAADPNDESALRTLVEVHYQAGNDALEVDEETGSVTITDTAEQEYNETIAAWEDYLEVAKKPDDGTASIANQAYGVLLQNSEPASVPTLAKDAVGPAEIVAEATPGVGTYSTLAQYAYFAGDEELGDEAAKKAVAEADPSQKKQLQKQLDATAKAAADLIEQIEKQAKKGDGEEAFSNPLEQGIGGGTLPGAPAPGTPPAP
jgi:hypothetical protein